MLYADEGGVVAEGGLEAGRVSELRGDVFVGAASARCEGRATERASLLRIGQECRGREGGLRAESESTSGSCECLVRGKGN